LHEIAAHPQPLRAFDTPIENSRQLAEQAIRQSLIFSTVKAFGQSAPTPQLLDKSGSHLGQGHRRYKKTGKTTERGAAE
jgi:hypothetical protein